MKSEAVRTTGADDIGHMIWLASRCVGRWPSGAPLVLAPGADDPRSSDRDDFLYGGDPDGLACPLGAHIRRTNPRDVIKPYADRSIPQHVRGPSPAPPSAGLRAGSARSGCPDGSRRPGRADSSARDRRRRHRARHSFLLRQREHQEPVRVRAADLVQQPSLRGPQRQQGSDSRRQRPDRIRRRAT